MVIRRNRHLIQPVATLRRSDNVRRDSANPAARPDFRAADALQVTARASMLLCVTVRLATAKIGGTYGKHGGVEKCIQDLD